MLEKYGVLSGWWLTGGSGIMPSTHGWHGICNPPASASSAADIIGLCFQIPLFTTIDLLPSQVF